MISLKTMLAGLRAIAPKASALKTRQERELRGMSDRELSDLGVGASEIPYLLRETNMDVAGGAATPSLGAGTAPARESTKGKGSNESLPYCNIHFRISPRQ